MFLFSDWHPTSPLIGVALDCAPFVVANPLIRSLVGIRLIADMARILVDSACAGSGVFSLLQWSFTG